MLTIGCPVCNYQFMVADKMLETGAKCPQCQHIFTPSVPAPPDVPAPKAETIVPAPAPKTDSGPRVGILVGSVQAEAPPATFRQVDPLPPPKPFELAGAGRGQAAFSAPEDNSLMPKKLPDPQPPSSQPPRLTTLVSDIVNKVVHQTAAPERKGIAELTVIALTLGLIALGITWPLKQGWLGSALSVVGLVLAATAVVKLLRSKIPGLALPVTAVVVNTQAVILSAILVIWPPEVTVQGQPADPFPDIAELGKSLSAADASVRAHAVSGVGALARSLGNSIPDLLTALNDAKPEVREAAADALGNMGPLAKAAFPALDDLAKTDPREGVRRRCLDAKNKIGEPQQADLSDFLATMKDSRASLRAAAAQAIGMIGPDARDAGSALEKALADSSNDVRISAAQALWNIKRKSAKDLMPIAVSCLQDRKSESVRSRAALTLGSFPSVDNEALDALQEALEDSSSKVRIQAAFALGNIGLGAKKAVPKLEKALSDSEVKVQLVAAQALWVLNKQADGVPALARALKNSDSEIKINAAMILGRIGKEARAAVPALALALSDADPGVRARVAEALYHIGPEANEAVPALMLALDHTDIDFRAQAAFALSGIGPAAKLAVGRLRLALKDDNPANVRLFAAQAMWAIEGKEDEALLVLKEILENKESTLRPQAALVLSLIGPKAAQLAPKLHEALGDADPALRAAAAKALGDIGGPLTRPSYSNLFELAKEDQPDEIIRSAAAEAVKKIGRPVKADVPTLIAALDKKYPASYRAGAAVSLWLLNREAKSAVSALSKALSDPDPVVCKTVTFALAAIGPDAAEAVPALIKALEQGEEELQGRAAYALGEIGPKAGKAVAPLSKVLADDTKKLSLRLHAAQALWAIAEESKEPLGPMVRSLIDVLSKGVLSQELKEDDLRIHSAETLAKIAAHAKDGDQHLKTALKEVAVPALEKALDGNRKYLRPAAAEALGALGFHGRDSIPALLAVLKETDPELRMAAAEALGKIGAAETQADKNAVRTKAAYSDLLFLSKVDQNEQVQKTAGTALAKIGRPSAGDVEILLQLLEDKKKPVHYRQAAAQALDMGEEAAKATGRLGKVLADKEDDPAVRALAAFALGDIGPSAKSELPALLAALRTPDAGIKAGACYALGEIFLGMQKLPADVLPELELAAEHPDINVKEAAKAAIKKIKGKQ